MDVLNKRVEINVSGNPDTMTQADSQRVKRCSNMLRDNGFDVQIKWGGDYAATKEFNTRQDEVYASRVVAQ